VPLAEQVAEEARNHLGGILNSEVPMTMLPAEGHYQHGAEMYAEVRRRLLPEECDQRVFNELRGILAPDITLRDAKKIVEKHKIEVTLRKTGGNITHAAKELGIHRPQLSNLLKKHALRRELFEHEVELSEDEDEDEGEGESPGRAEEA
jgi:DNA-binding NtrC family response regulator